MKHSAKHLIAVVGATVLASVAGSAWAAGETLTVVYWSAKDCRWCTDGKIKGYPSFSLYEGDKFVAYALGEEDIDGKLLPAIRERMKK